MMSSCETLGYLCFYGAILLGTLLFVLWATSEEKAAPSWKWSDWNPNEASKKNSQVDYIFNTICASVVLAVVIWASLQPPCE